MNFKNCLHSKYIFGTLGISKDSGLYSNSINFEHVECTQNNNDRKSHR